MEWGDLVVVVGAALVLSGAFELLRDENPDDEAGRKMRNSLVGVIGGFVVAGAGALLIYFGV